MTTAEKLQNELKKIEQVNYEGYYPYTIRPKSEKAKLFFAKFIRVDLGDDVYASVYRMADQKEQETLRQYLTEENYKKSRFNGNAKVYYREDEEKQKISIKNNIVAELQKITSLHEPGDFIVNVGDFVEYPAQKNLTYSDIVDLRNQ